MAGYAFGSNPPYEVPQMLHQQPAVVALLRCQQQVLVIGHETGGVTRARELRGQGLQSARSSS